MGSIIVDNYDSDQGNYSQYYSLINLSDFSFSSLKIIGGDITYHYIKNDRTDKREEGYGEIKKAPRFVMSLHDINAICLFDKDEDVFISLETINNLNGNGFGFPNLKKNHRILHNNREDK